MNLRIILLTLIVFPLFAAAASAATPRKCGIQSLSDAKSCMYKLSSQPEFKAEDDPDVIVTSQTHFLATILKGHFGITPELRQAQEADYVGAIIFHDDEHHIIYFVIKNGRNVQPEEVYDLNLADLGSTFRRRLGKSSPLADPNLYVLGENIRKYDIEEDVKYALEEAMKEER